MYKSSARALCVLFLLTQETSTMLFTPFLFILRHSLSGVFYGLMPLPSTEIHQRGYHDSQAASTLPPGSGATSCYRSGGSYLCQSPNDSIERTPHTQDKQPNPCLYNRHK